MKKSQIALLLSVLLCLGLYFMVPSIHVHLNHAVRVLSSLNLESVILYLREFGTYAALISFFTHDSSVYYRTYSCFFDYPFQCCHFWMGVGSYVIVEQCNGWSGFVFFYRTSFRA